MVTPTKLWAGATALLAALAGWLYLDNRALRADAERLRAATPDAPAAAPAVTGAATAAAEQPSGEPRGFAALGRALAKVSRREPAAPSESRAERRSRRAAEIAALFGREAGESEQDYRERVTPMITGALERPRERALELRREAEAKAGVTAEQSAKVDAALASAYDELVAYTDAAIADGQLSPYQRNVSGWLSYAGGLGGILGNTESKIGEILQPAQVQAMYDAGFEWGEFLGVSAPWERLAPPPPAR
jgi:hypothetical protein